MFTANESLPESEVPAIERNEQNEPIEPSPSWLHPLSLFFDLANILRSQLWPTVAAIFAASTSIYGVIFAAIFFSFSLLRAVFHYLTLRYRLRDGDFVLDEGFLFRRHRTVPLQKIQNVDLVQNIFHRLLGVAEVRIETASGKEPEATLRVLSLKDVERLREQIFRGRGVKAAAQGPQQATPFNGRIDRANEELGKGGLQNKGQGGFAADPSNNEVELVSTCEVSSRNDSVQSRANAADQAIAPQTILTISPWQLVKAGLISNRGTVLVAVIVGFFFQGGWERHLSWKFDWNDVVNWVPPGTSRTSLAVLGIVGLLFGLVSLFLFFRLLSILWYLIRFYGYRLTQVGEDLRIECGLLTRVSATIPVSRIQFVSIHRNWLGKALGIASIRIETAGGGGKEHEDAASTVSRQWFAPVLDESDVPRLIAHLRPGFVWDESSVEWKPLSPRAVQRLMRLVLMISVLTCVATYWFWGWWSLLVGSAVGLCGGWFAKKKASSMRYARADFGIAYRSGFLTKKCSIAFLDRIQSVKLSDSPFDRRWKMATLSVDTIAAGPADHRIHIPMLDAAFAREEYHAIALQASSSFR